VCVCMRVTVCVFMCALQMGKGAKEVNERPRETTLGEEEVVRGQVGEK